MALTKPTRTHSSPRPVRTPAAQHGRDMGLADRAVDAESQFARLAGILVGLQVVGRAVGVVDRGDAGARHHPAR